MATNNLPTYIHCGTASRSTLAGAFHRRSMGFFEGVAHRPAACKRVSRPAPYREPLVRLVFGSALHRVQSIKEHPLTGASDVLNRRRSLGCIANKRPGECATRIGHGQVVDDGLEVLPCTPCL